MLSHSSRLITFLSHWTESNQSPRMLWMEFDPFMKQVDGENWRDSRLLFHVLFMCMCMCVYTYINRDRHTLINKQIGICIHTYIHTRAL